MTSNDVLDRTADARPDAATAARLWPDAQRDAALASVLAGRPATATRRHSRRTRLVGGAVAAGVVALALVATTAVLPSDNPAGPTGAAAVLNGFAVRAGETPADTMKPGQFWHTTEREEVLYYGETKPEVTTRLSWAGTDGSIWRRDKHAGKTWTYLFPANGTPSLNGPTPALLATFPTDRAELRELIDEQYAGNYGSEEHGERVLVAVGDMLRQGFAPPALREAALGVLADLPGVEVREGMTDVAGRKVTGIRVPGLNDAGNGQSYLLFDPVTARIVGERSDFTPTKRQAKQDVKFTVAYSSVTTDQGVVDSVPRDIRRTAIDPETEADIPCSVDGTC